jgi:hypothetical protein
VEIKLQGLAGGQLLHVEIGKDQTVKAQPGYSGSPAWDYNTGVTVGLVQVTPFAKEPERDAYLLPPRVIAHAWREQFSYLLEPGNPDSDREPSTIIRNAFTKSDYAQFQASLNEAAGRPAEQPIKLPVQREEEARGSLSRKKGYSIAAAIAITTALVAVAAVLTVVRVTGLWAGHATPSDTDKIEATAPYQLSSVSPEKSELTLPLKIGGPGLEHNWTLTLHLQLASAMPADACVYDSQLTYTLRNNGAVVSSGRPAPGQSQITVGPLHIGDTGQGHQLQLTVSVMVGEADAGCQFTLDPSETSLTSPGGTG